MTGFEIARLDLNGTLKRLEELKDIAVLPMDEEGLVIEDDPLAHDSAREIRLLLQRLLDLDLDAFLGEMRRLYFHLFAIDHDHYRDLLLQAAQRDPARVRDIAMDFLVSEDVLFFDDQYTLHDVFDVLEQLGAAFLDDRQRAQLISLLAEPFFRLPSVHARVIKLLGASLTPAEAPLVRRLFEMDWIPAKELTWDLLVPALRANGVAENLLATPRANPRAFDAQVTAADFEDLRWMAGIECGTTALRLRMLGSIVADGPMAADTFMRISEMQPETAFNRGHFETDGHRHAFLTALERLGEEIAREAHQSGDWFMNVAPDRTWGWAPPPPGTPWPRALAELTGNWGEFANPTDDTDFATEAEAEIKAIDDIGDEVADLLKRHPFPSAEMLAEGDQLLARFRAAWERLLPRILPRLNVLP